MIDTPSYTLNHEEVAKALEEGVRFAESVTPDEVEVDRYGHAAALWSVGEDAGGRARANASAINIGCGGDAAEYSIGGARMLRTCSSTANGFKLSTKMGSRGEAAAVGEAVEGFGVDVDSRGWARD